MAGEDIEYRLKALEDDSLRNQQTHKEFFARFEKMSTEYTRIDAQYANILTTLAKLESAIEELKAKPAKRWDGIVDKLIWAVLAAVLGFVLAQVGIA